MRSCRLVVAYVEKANIGKSSKRFLNQDLFAF